LTQGSVAPNALLSAKGINYAPYAAHGQMEAVCHLDGVGRAFSIGTGVVPHDDLPARMLTKPAGEILGGAIVEQIDRPMRLQVEQQGAIAALLPTQRHIVDAQHAEPTLMVVIGQCVQDAKQRVRADRHASGARQASATFAAGL
jgi:hypothetical protein